MTAVKSVGFTVVFYAENDAILMQLCYKIDACLCYRVFGGEGHALMKIKRLVLFCVMGLVLWAAWEL